MLKLKKVFSAFVGVAMAVNVLMTMPFSAFANDAEGESVQSEIVFVQAGFYPHEEAIYSQSPELYEGIFTESSGNVRKFSFQNENDDLTFGTLTFSDSSSIYASANSDEYEYELNLTCSSSKFFDDEDTTTYFYVETDYEGEHITLVNADDLTEYTMLDDGKFSVSGDDLPYDGVYSLRLELDSSGSTYEKPKVLSFYAVTEDGIKSDLITIQIVKRITTLQISEMASVDKMINTLVESENYTSASFDEKTSMVYDLLVNLAEHGTEEYPYSLIFPDSISFTGTIYSFKYSCGALGGVSITDLFPGEETTTTTDDTETTTETTITSDTESTAKTTETETTSTTTETTLTSTADTTAGTTVSTETTPATTTTTEETTLPQTGYSKWYHVAAALAACMTGIGGAMLIGSSVMKKKRR